MSFIDTIKDVSLARELSGKNAAERAQEAAADLEARIQQGQAVQQAANPFVQAAQQAGVAQARGDIQGGLAGGIGALNQGFGQQQQFLGQAGGLFDPASELAQPALSSLQQGATIGGQAQSLRDILADPTFAGLFEDVQRQTQNQLSSAGLRRSGAGSQISSQNLLNTAFGLEQGLQGRQQNLANIGLGGLGQQANILGQQGAVAGQQGSNLANLQAQAGGALANIAQTGGSEEARLLQQAAANEVNLLGQLGQAGAAGALGSSAAQQQGAQNLAQTGIGIAGLFSDIRLKNDVKKIGEHKCLNVYSWTWNENANDIGLFGESFGHIAQEVKEIKPHLVFKEGEYFGVNYGTDETVDIDVSTFLENSLNGESNGE